MTTERVVFATVVSGLSAVALLGTYRWLEARQLQNSAWQSADDDGDGVPLERDLDPDGDGLDALSDPDADGDGVENVLDILTFARGGVGQPTDPLMGKYENLLGRAGFVVCVDVPVDAWMAAGVSLPQVLRAAAAANPQWFTIDPANAPTDPNFVRRVRNYRDLFEHDPALLVDDHARAGDLAFYGRNHVALVTGGGDDYRVIEAYGSFTNAVSGRDVERRTGVRAEFGRVR